MTSSKLNRLLCTSCKEQLWGSWEIRRFSGRKAAQSQGAVPQPESQEELPIGVHSARRALNVSPGGLMSKQVHIVTYLTWLVTFFRD